MRDLSHGIYRQAAEFVMPDSDRASRMNGQCPQIHKQIWSHKALSRISAFAGITLIVACLLLITGCENCPKTCPADDIPKQSCTDEADPNTATETVIVEDVPVEHCQVAVEEPAGDWEELLAKVPQRDWPEQYTYYRAPGVQHPTQYMFMEWDSQYGSNANDALPFETWSETDIRSVFLNPFCFLLRTINLPYEATYFPPWRMVYDDYSSQNEPQYELLTVYPLADPNWTAAELTAY